MQFVEAHERYSAAYAQYLEVCRNEGLDYYTRNSDEAELFLKHVVSHAQGICLPEGWGSYSTYFCINTEEVLGTIRLRHSSNAFIENVIGHIGYETKPAARNLGIATFMLQHIKELLTAPAILACSATNTASQKVMQNSGATYLDSHFNASEGREITRYLLPTLTNSKRSYATAAIK